MLGEGGRRREARCALMPSQEPQKDLMTSGTKGMDQNLTYGRVEPRNLARTACTWHERITSCSSSSWT